MRIQQALTVVPAVAMSRLLLHLWTVVPQRHRQPTMCPHPRRRIAAVRLLHPRIPVVAAVAPMQTVALPHTIVVRHPFCLRTVVLRRHPQQTAVVQLLRRLTAVAAVAAQTRMAAHPHTIAVVHLLLTIRRHPRRRIVAAWLHRLRTAVVAIARTRTVVVIPTKVPAAAMTVVVLDILVVMVADPHKASVVTSALAEVLIPAAAKDLVVALALKQLKAPEAEAVRDLGCPNKAAATAPDKPETHLLHADALVPGSGSRGVLASGVPIIPHVFSIPHNWNEKGNYHLF